ncbi:transposase [Streptomyces sp. W4I9-2]|nr:transposase [Streptomyces sp. W4I9-2]
MPWGDLPHRCGPWQTVCARFRRNTVERCFNRLEHFRAIATRYDEVIAFYEAAVSPASFAALGAICLKTGLRPCLMNDQAVAIPTC